MSWPVPHHYYHPTRYSGHALTTRVYPHPPLTPYFKGRTSYLLIVLLAGDIITRLGGAPCFVRKLNNLTLHCFVSPVAVGCFVLLLHSMSSDLQSIIQGLLINDYASRTIIHKFDQSSRLHANTQLQWPPSLRMIIVSNKSVPIISQWRNVCNHFVTSAHLSQRGICAYYSSVVSWLIICPR